MRIRKKISRVWDYLVQGILVLMLLFFFGYFFIGEISLPSQRTIDKNDCTLLDLEWKWQKADNSIETISLPGVFDVKMGEHMIISARIPDLQSDTIIMYWNKGADLKVKVDGKARYEFSNKNSQWVGKANSYTYVFIKLFKEDAGKEITFDLMCETRSSGNLGEVYIGDSASELIYAVTPYQFELFVAIILIVLGVLCVVLDFLILFRNRQMTYILYLGCGVILAAFWILMNSQARQFVFPNTSIVHDCAFFAVPLMLVPFLMYIDRIQRLRYHIFFLIVELLLSIGYILLIAVYFMTDKIYFDEIIWIIVIAFTLLAVTLVIDIFRKKVKTHKTIAVGLAGMLGAGIVQIAYYIAFPYKAYSGTIVVVGLFILIIAAMADSISFIFKINDKKLKAEMKVEKLSIQAMETLARVVDAKDKYTSGHCERVAKYSVMIGKRLNYPEAELKRLHYLALLHDVGKIGVPDYIINKETKLTEDEYETIKTHSKIGAEILSQIHEIEDLDIGAHWHHEKYDGSGYPDGLKGEEIPEIARIIAVADAYDAMTSNRSYRKYLTQEKVREEFVQNKGKQFDPKFADIMIEIIDEDTQYEYHE